MRFQKILCPVDFSEVSQAAARAAVDLAGPDGSVTLLYAYQVPYMGYSEGLFVPNFLDVVAQQADKDLSALVAHLQREPKVRIETVKVAGVPWDEIVKAAREGRHDLIVTGSHGRTGLKHALLGSVAEKVARHAPCPVLIWRMPNKE